MDAVAGLHPVVFGAYRMERVARPYIHLGAAVFLTLAACGSGDLTRPTSDAGTPDAGFVYDAGVTVSATTAFSVMTWNIEMFPKTTRTASAVIDILDQLEPDLVGVQELRHPGAFDLLVEALPDYDGEWVFDEFLSIGVLYRKDRVRVSNVVPLFEGDSFAFPRPLLSAEVEVLGPRGEVRFDFVFITLHLKAQGDSRSQSRRLRAIQKLDAYISEKLAAGGEQDYIVLGDYNDRLLDEGINNVFQVMLDQPERYTFLTYPLEAFGETSYIPFSGFIDHIMITNDALAEFGAGYAESIAMEVMRPDYESVVSDHRPIRAVFELP